jgi:hypothetical protein
MFLLNLGYKWTMSDTEGLRGAVLLAAHNPASRTSRDARMEFPRVLFDPQLYLAALDAERCTTACGYLAGYPWFAVPGVKEFDSATMGRREWVTGLREHALKNWPGKPPGDIEPACITAIEFQQGMGCTHVILPTPLVEEREDEGETLGQWLDCALAVAEQLEVPQPLLATVAVSDVTLNEAAFEEAGFLDALVDHVTARGGLSGAYVVIAQTGSLRHPFDMPANVVKGYLHLAAAFADAGVDEILLNFADLVGYLALGVGATAFVSGASQRLRTLQLDGMADRGGGPALPHYYSHKTIGEYLTETDLDRIARADLVRRITDETTHSASLLSALRKGQSASTLTAWAESQGNTTAASRHFVRRLVLEGEAMAARGTREERREVILDWIETGEANALYIARRLEKLGKSSVGKRPATDEWRAALAAIGGE